MLSRGVLRALVTRAMVVGSIILLVGFGQTGLASSPERIRFMPARCNPVLVPGQPGAWDGGVVFLPKVVQREGVVYMFYTGTSGAVPEMGAQAIGVAASSDGLIFSKFTRNPLLEATGTGFAAYSVSEGVPFVDGDTFILLYNARSSEGHGPGRFIGRATAPDPTGPWIHDLEPVLTVGPEGAWDCGFVSPNCVVTTGEGYALYYSGGKSFTSGEPRWLGMATSPDGINWTKYDEPQTMGPAFAESDPLLQLGPAGSWDSLAAWEASIRQTKDGWEMFYEGIGPVDTPIGHAVQIGYATSVDGIHWLKYENNPILGLGVEPLAESFGVEVPSVIANKCYHYLYYGYGLHIGVIGVALGTVSEEVTGE